MPSILPTHFPSSPNPHPSHPLPTPLPSAANSPLSITPRTCSSVIQSSLTSNLLTRLLVNPSTYNVTHRTCSSVTLSSTTSNMFLSPLVPLSTCPVPCLLWQATCSPVHPSTHQLTMLLIELVHLLPCLFLPPTCSPVPLSPVFLPCQHHLLPPYAALICKLFLSSYFFVGTFPKHCNANSSLFVTHFYRQKRNYQ